MRYSHSRDTSAETFRLVLKKMTDLRLSFTPIHYAVIYEYVSGINPPLSQAVAALLRTSPLPPAPEIERIFLLHIVPDILAQHDPPHPFFTRDLQELLGSLFDTSQSAAKKTARAETSFESARAGLEGSGPVDPNDLLGRIRVTLDSTLQIRESSLTLEEQLKESEREILRLTNELQQALIESQRDPLTNLLNRRGFEEVVERALSRESSEKKEMTLLLLDIDHFKKINDSYGHRIGDKVIQAVARVIAQHVHSPNIAARIGGEEFAVVLSESDPEKGTHLADQIRSQIEQIGLLDTKTHRRIDGISISIGINSGRSLRTMLERADLALYRAKSGGRNAISVFLDQQDLPPPS